MGHRCKLVKCPVMEFRVIKNGTSLQVLRMTGFRGKKNVNLQRPERDL